MISKELKRLSRKELVEIIYQLKKNEQQMQQKIEELDQEVRDKRIRISMAGSIAEASMSVTNVFATAQLTADLYLREISYMKEDAEREAKRLIESAQKEAEQILAEARAAALQTEGSENG